MDENEEQIKSTRFTYAYFPTTIDYNLYGGFVLQDDLIRQTVESYTSILSSIQELDMDDSHPILSETIITYDVGIRLITEASGRNYGRVREIYSNVTDLSGSGADVIKSKKNIRLFSY